MLKRWGRMLGQNSDNSFLLGLTVDQLRGAVLSMYAAAKPSEQVPDETPESIESLLSKLRKGDRDAYMAPKSEINELRLASMRFINELSDGIRSAESCVHSLEVQEGQIYFAYFGIQPAGAYRRDVQRPPGMEEAVKPPARVIQYPVVGDNQHQKNRAVYR